MVLPEDLIKLWNKNTNSLEGATLEAMKEYLNLQDTLVEKINQLIALSEKINNEALKYNPEALFNYLDMLVKDGQAVGLCASQLEALIKASKAIQIELKIERGDVYSNISVVEILHKVKKELERRSMLDAKAREQEESSNCNFYNGLRKTLPKEIRKEAPPEIPMSNYPQIRERWEKMIANGMGGTMSPPIDYALEENVSFKENLKAIVQLLRVLLSKGIFEVEEFTS